MDGSLVFFAMLLYDAMLGLFAAIAFSYNDVTSAIVLAVSGLLVFLGLTLQMIVGFNLYIRSFYGMTGVLVFSYVVTKGGDASALFGPLGLIFGFVVVLGWRLATWYLATIGLLLVAIFYWDVYLDVAAPFSLLIELKFFITYIGLALLALGYGYAVETRVERLENYSRKMGELAYKDSMTNLPNRRSTEDLLAQRWEEHKRVGSEFAILLCNIDNFKELNNQYGSGFGDGVILRIANVLSHGLRTQDIVSRWNGDEFLIILPGQAVQSALKAGERLRARVEKIDLVMRGRPVKVTVSFGAASVEHSLGPSDLVSMAETGLYQAKHTGKNRVMIG